MIYNLDKINEMADGDEDFIKSVVSVFLEEVPGDMEALEAALEQKNHHDVYMLAHKIKPNVDLLGMEQSRANALEMETKAKNKEGFEEIAKVFPILKTDIQQVVSELKKDFGL